MRFLAPTLILLATTALQAGEDKAPSPFADIVGSWDVRTKFDGRETPSVLELSVGKDGKLAGMWNSVGRDTPVSKLRYENGVLEFVRAMRGREIAFKATLKDGKLSGAHQMGQREIPATGRKLSQAELTDPANEFERNSMRAAPRDAFPVLDNPKMTSALEATIEDGEFVIGVVVNKEAKAYPVRVMGIHELLNDDCGGDPITASW